MSYKTVDVDIELDDVIEYIENCYSDKELQKIKAVVMDGLNEVDDSAVEGYIRNTQNYETAKEAFFNTVNHGIDLNKLTNILDNLA